MNLATSWIFNHLLINSGILVPSSQGILEAAAGLDEDDFRGPHPPSSTPGGVLPKL